MGPSGIEPLTSSVSRKRSPSELRARGPASRRRPELNRGNGFCRPAPNHSATSPKDPFGSKRPAASRPRSGRRGSNPRPQPWQGCALPAELLPPVGRIVVGCHGEPNGSHLPVEPNPPAPRSETGSSATSLHTTAGTGVMTSWATRSPRSKVTTSSPWLMSSTLISPR